MPTPLFHRDTTEMTVVQRLVTQFSFCSEWQSIYPACCQRSWSDGANHLLSHRQLGAVLVVLYIFCSVVLLVTREFAAGGIVVRRDNCVNKLLATVQRKEGRGRGRNMILYRSTWEVASSHHLSSLVRGSGRNLFGHRAKATQFGRRRRRRVLGLQGHSVGPRLCLCFHDSFRVPLYASIEKWWTSSLILFCVLFGGRESFFFYPSAILVTPLVPVWFMPKIFYVILSSWRVRTLSYIYIYIYIFMCELFACEFLYSFSFRF